MKVSVEVAGQQEAQLAEEAKRLHVRAEELATAALQDPLAQRDAAFRQAAARDLEENRDLYRRLA